MQIIIQNADDERIGSLHIPNNADLVFVGFSEVTDQTMAELQKVMSKAVEVTIQITEEPPELQVSSTLVHQAILTALLTRVRYPLVAKETIRIISA